ncbi:OmpA family protein [Nesterenkonia flava]|uniref:OmpA family protein n=1 Tax=Nesterenkonia flava TaxID=469799 RepID=A0ABU1FS89_9MICC|nr:OmpA family protein [Nesterenkonia flava]MDR5711537.1 OmpA family protein [Nesterenkonia flava]
MARRKRSAVRDPFRSLALPSAGLLLACGLLAGAPSAYASGQEDEQLPDSAPEIPAEGRESLHDYILAPDAEDYILRIDPEDYIDRLGTSESEEDDVIVLETDILFPAMEWELPASAAGSIGDLVDVVPEGATVRVHGHTDSNPVPEGYDFDNQQLSENRAQAVADVLEQERPDLRLEVEGFGDSQPAVQEDPEDPGTLAENRRVEIRYGEA